MSQRQTLDQLIATAPQFARSVNIERDAGTGDLDGYLPTARALETTRRVAAAIADRRLTRAWSVTGPYGSGKSSLAVLLDALCGRVDDPRRIRALAVLRDVDPATADSMATALDLAPTSGFIRAGATAQREPAARTIVRAIAAGLERHDGPARRRAALGRTAARMLDSEINARVAADFLADVCELGPVLLILDEFGKNLEFFAETGGSADLFVLQEIAERAAGPDGLPLFLLTLQHLAFEDYATGASVVQRREWAKVQGRFEDIPYTDAPTELLELIARVFRVSDDRFVKRINQWATLAHREVSTLGLADLLQSEQLLAACYPLQPLTLAVLPELCNRYGQRERTLFSFLARPEPNAVPSFMAAAAVGNGELPCVGLDKTYDYFVSSAGTIVGTADGASRWLEIDSRISETQGLSTGEVRCLKVIGVLNLVSRGGVLRASTDMVRAALPDVAVSEVIPQLEARGILVYRAFADEYRIWQGSDFDLQGAIEDARRRLSGEPVGGLCERALPLGPLVAARHSQERGVLRFFARAYVDGTSTIVAPGVDDDEDGLLAYIVDNTPPGDLRIDPQDSAKPVLLVYPSDGKHLRSSAADAAAVAEVLRTADELERDWVARREMHERAALAIDRFRTTLAEAFDLKTDARVRLSDGTVVPTAGGRTWSSVLSSVCDDVFSATPVLRNEMLVRRTLSSQAARARRDLLTGMVERQGDPKLGIEGYGPERAMLEAVLLHPGIYRDRPNGWSFGPPPRTSDVRVVWKAITEQLISARRRHIGLDAVWRTLKAPPFGLPEGPIPVLVAAALLANSDELAIYQDGTFQAFVGVELLERIAKAPERFTVKHFSTGGARSKVVDALSGTVQSRPKAAGRRNTSLLGVLNPILATIRGLPEYTRRTTDLSEPALRTRAALTRGTEPDELIFRDLPMALGLDPFHPTGAIPDDRVDIFVRLLMNALDELQNSYASLLDSVRASLADGIGVPSPASLGEVRANIGTTARRLVDSVLEPRLRSFLLAASDQHLEDVEWVEYVAMNVAERPAPAWRDEDRRRFDAALVEMLSAMRRVAMLHFERLDMPDGAALTRQVTVTTPDGYTAGAVVWLDEVVAATLNDVVERATEEAVSRLGHRGVEALLALLADRMLAVDGAGVDTTVAPLPYGPPDEEQPDRKKHHG